MVDRLISVGDDLTLPAAVQVPASRIPDLADAIAAAGVGEIPTHGTSADGDVVGLQALGVDDERIFPLRWVWDPDGQVGYFAPGPRLPSPESAEGRVLGADPDLNRFVWVELPGRGAIPYWDNEVGLNPVEAAGVVGAAVITPGSAPDLRYSSLGLKLRYYGTTAADYVYGRNEISVNIVFSQEFGQKLYDAMARPTAMTLSYFVGLAMVYLGNTMVPCQYELAMGVWGAELGINVPVPAGVTSATEIGVVI